MFINVKFPKLFKKQIEDKVHFGQLFSKVWDTKYNYRMKAQERFMKVGCQQ